MNKSWSRTFIISYAKGIQLDLMKDQIFMPGELFNNGLKNKLNFEVNQLTILKCLSRGDFQKFVNISANHF